MSGCEEKNENKSEKPSSEGTSNSCGTFAPYPTGEEYHLKVSAVAGHCKAGEEWSCSALQKGQLPVISCEGPCVKGEIARRAASILPAIDSRWKRACHGEAFFVAHSSMARWVKESPRVLSIDGCFLACHRRVLEHIIPPHRVLHINAHAIHKSYTDTFSYEEIPDSDLHRLAVQVARSVRL